MRPPRGAVAAIVLGVVGLFTVPFILSPIAIVLGARAERAAEAEPHRYDGTLGRVGRILGWIGVAIVLVAIVVGVLAVVFFVLAGDNTAS